MAFSGEQQIDEAALRATMRDAVDRGEFRVYYQPIVGFDPGEVAGFEALLRWEHPEYGVLTPAQFLGIAEDNGLIVPIGAAVLEAACRQGAQWVSESAGERPLTIAVNLSARQLVAHDLLGAVTQALSRSGLDPHLLILEVTGSRVAGCRRSVCADPARLDALGVQLCVDDFGKRQSLRMLRRSPGVGPQDRPLVRDRSRYERRRRGGLCRRGRVGARSTSP
jgi:EAL domain-containing protein (putative c-di-GMP-specific phosphodiesterase class I)